jgi:hypothetical protein
MPLILEAVLSFSEQSSEIEDGLMFLDEATGTRLDYIDVAWLSRSVRRSPCWPRKDRDFYATPKGVAERRAQISSTEYK